MSAETGVGPAIASGSQVWSGNWPLLPMMPMSRQDAPTSQIVGRLDEAAAVKNLDVKWNFDQEPAGVR